MKYGYLMLPGGDMGQSNIAQWWPSESKPGFWFIGLRIEGFVYSRHFALVDDFGNLVEVPR